MCCFAARVLWVAATFSECDSVLFLYYMGLCPILHIFGGLFTGDRLIDLETVEGLVYQVCTSEYLAAVSQPVSV